MRNLAVSKPIEWTFCEESLSCSWRSLYVFIHTSGNRDIQQLKDKNGAVLPGIKCFVCKKKRLCALVVQARVVDGQGLVCKADITGVHHQYTSTDAYVWDADKSRYSVALPFYGFRHRGG